MPGPKEEHYVEELRAKLLQERANRQNLINIANGAPIKKGAIRWTNKIIIANNNSFALIKEYFGPAFKLNERTRIELLHPSDELFITLLPHLSLECAIKNVNSAAMISIVLSRFYIDLYDWNEPYFILAKLYNIRNNIYIEYHKLVSDLLN